MLTKVILEGAFAKVAGRKVWMLDVNSPAEAIQLISANCQGKILTWIRQNLADYKICEVECESIDGKKEQLTSDTYPMERQCKTIRFLPIFTGAGGNGGLQAILGVVMIVIGCILISTPFGAPLIASGIGMILGAICTMLMKPSDDKEKDTGSSYYFNGAVNTTTQGNPVPLVFGRCRVGSAVISSSIDIAEGK